jgi:hypothetical protein
MDLPLRSLKQRRMVWPLSHRKLAAKSWNGLTGIILEEPSPTCIAEAVRDCIANPDRLERLAFASRVRDKFTIQALARELQPPDGAL